MKTTFIYELVDPRTNEVKYIGKSNKPEYRLRNGHLGNSELKYKTYKNNWIKKLKKENLQPILNIIDEVNRNEWEYWEKFYIGAYKAIGYKLTNATLGGDGFASGSLNPAKDPKIKKLLSIQKLGDKNPAKRLEVRQKISNSNKGKKLSIEHKQSLQKGRKNYTITKEAKQKISLSKLGKPRSEETKKKISEAHKGKIAWNKGFTKETCEGVKRMSESKIGKKRSEETKLKISQAQQKRTEEEKNKIKEKFEIPILQFSLKGIFIKKWKSATKAGKFLNINIVGIRNCINGRSKSSGGYIWKKILTK